MPYVKTGYRIRIERVYEHIIRLGEEEDGIEEHRDMNVTVYGETGAMAAVRRYFAGETP